MKPFVFSCLLFLSISQSFSVDFKWGRGIGADWYDQAYSMTHDIKGNIYVTGLFADTVDFDPAPNKSVNLVSKGFSDIFVMKLDTGGNLVWVRQFGSTSSDEGFSIAVDKWGGVLVTGHFYFTVDFDPDPAKTYNLVSIGSSDAFVLKLDKDGIFMWARNVGSLGSEVGASLSVDMKGNVYYVGEFNGKTDFDPGTGTFNLTPVMDRDAFVSKLDSGGRFIWAKQIGGQGFESVRSITVDQNGTVYFAGNFNRDADLDPGTGTYQIANSNQLLYFLVKLNLTGNFVWARVWPSQIQWANADKTLELDALKNIIITGNFKDTADFDPDPLNVKQIISKGKKDAFVMKLDPGGSLLWATAFGGTGTPSVEPYGIYGDDRGNIYTTGWFLGMVDFKPGAGTHNLVSVGGSYGDIFISKLSSSGGFIWAKSLGGEGLGYHISVDQDKNVYMAGLFSNTVDFNPDSSKVYNLSSKGKYDIAILKLEQCRHSASVQTKSACMSYVIDGNTYTASGTYKITITNYSGCDSVITLKLTIHQNTDTTIIKSACDSFTLDSHTYKSSGIYTYKLVNANGCDSIIKLDLVIHKKSDTVVYVSACDSLTWGQMVYKRSGVYKNILSGKKGCDSTITLHLQISSTRDTIIDSVCDSFILNNQVYRQSGIYTQRLPNSKGCDSILVLMLKVKSTQNTITATVCKSYKLNNISYYKSGNYSQIIPNAAGCDSLIRLNLKVIKIDTGIFKIGNQLFAKAIGLSYLYKWVNCTNGSPISGETDSVFSPALDGTYAVIVSLDQCSDTSTCYNFIKLGTSYVDIIENVYLYPNPVKDNEIGVFLPSGLSGAILAVYNTVGQKVSGTLVGKEGYNNLDLSGFGSGVYYLEISQVNAIARIKIVIP